MRRFKRMVTSKVQGGRFLFAALLLLSLAGQLITPQPAYAGTRQECLKAYDRIQPGGNPNNKSDYVLVYIKFDSNGANPYPVCGNDASGAKIGIAEWDLSATGLNIGGTAAHSRIFEFSAWRKGTDYYAFYEKKGNPPQQVNYIHMQDNLSAIMGSNATKIKVDDPQNILAVLQRYKNNDNPDVGTNTSTITLTQAAADEGDSCEDKGEDMGWVFCPVILGIEAALNWLDTQIQRLLEVDRDYYDDKDTKEAWANIRNLAFFILVPIMLVMVIGTAIGADFVSAYTVKKSLPRLFIAVIFISLSYHIAVFLIEFFNVIGRGILGLMTAPFGDGNNLTLAQLFNGSPFTSIIAAVPVGIGVIFLLAFFAPTLLLFAGTAFLLLFLRQLFIIALLLVAPLAILAWIFPANNRLWKLWWGAFSKLLMMFPLIMALIAVGRIFAYIIYQGGGGPLEAEDASIVRSLAMLLAWMLPYAFIPFTFKLAGGVFATITGMVNDKERGLFDRSKKWRAEKINQAQQDRMFNKHKYDPNSFRGRWARRLNTAASIATSNPLDTAHIYGGTARGKAKLSEIDAAKFQQTQTMAEALGKAGVTVDKGLEVLAGRRFGAIRTSADLDNAIQKLSQSDSDSDRLAAAQLQNARSFILSAHKNPDYGRGSLEGAALLSWSAQGFAGTQDIAAVSNSIGGGLGASIASQATFLGYKAGRPDLKPTYGVQANFEDGVLKGYSDGLQVPTNERGDIIPGPEFETVIERQKKLVKGLKTNDLALAKGSSIDSMKYGMKRLVEEAKLADNQITMARRDGSWDTLDEATKQSLLDTSRLGASMKEIILQQSSQYSSLDPDSRSKYKGIRDQLADSGVITRTDIEAMEAAMLRRSRLGEFTTDTAPPPHTGD